MSFKRSWIIGSVKTFLAVLVGICALDFLIAPAWATTVTIDTTRGLGPQGESVAPFGDGIGAGTTYGQTFVTPANYSVLESFSFWAWHAPDLDNSGQSLYFTAVVAAWATDRALQPVLYESAIQLIDINQTTPQEFVFSTGGLQLTPGQKYVAFLNASTPFWDTNTTKTRVGFIGGGSCCGGGDAYTDGEAWFLGFTFNEFDRVFDFAWDNQFGVSDLAFRAEFSAIPVPAAAWLFLSALGILSRLRLRTARPE